MKSLIEEDFVISEEPLEILLASPKNPSPKESFMVTMRTPGADFELVCGILFNLGFIANAKDILQFKYTITTKEKTQVLVTLRENNQEISRQTFVNSSCGVCNFANWDDVSQHSQFPVMNKAMRIKTSIIHNSFSSSLNRDDYFHATGGNHKVTLFNSQGELVLGAEDVGRHNAFDKLIGRALSDGLIPMTDHFAVLSGRCSFEMCQKAWMSGIPFLASIGAPTSKAIELAENAGITLIGFLKPDSFNVYTHDFRLVS